MIKNKKGFEMNFAWIFSIIAGVTILFLAIYATSQFIKTRKYEIDTQTAAKLSILLDPLETSLESGKSSLITFPSETRIYNDKCYTYGNFGEQSIGVAGSSGGSRWQEPAYSKPQYNKYIFSQNIEQGEEFRVFSKPFNMPFKVSDLVFFLGQEYCFVNVFEDIEDEIKGLGIKNVHFTDKKSNCSVESEIVCFSSSSGCDVAVYGDFESGYVSKEGKNLQYSGPLVYGAIFSSSEVYECNVKRLMLRLVNLCLIQKDKIEVLESRGCGSLLDSHLNELISLARQETPNLDAIKDKAEEINMINDAAVCRLY